MGRTSGPRYAAGERVAVHVTEAGEREATWHAAHVVAWCEIADEVWVTVQWADRDILGMRSDLVPAARCRKVTPSGLRRA